MIYRMCYRITLGDRTLALLDSVRITKSVETLGDTAVITLPATHNNRTVEVEGKIAVGDRVTIDLGYNDEPAREFEGFIDKIGTDGGSITIECADSLFLFKKPVQDKEYANTNVKALLQEVVRQTDPSIRIECDYKMNYEKFTFFKASGLDVLKKVQDDTKANIYFEGGTLHVHAPYGKVADAAPAEFDFSRNIESSSLKYVKAADKKIEVEVSYTDSKGKTKKQTFGNKGGEKLHVVSRSASTADHKRLAESTHNLFCYDGYEGDFTGWLLPFADPTYRVRLTDAEYPEKDGTYYVTATEVEFGSGGGRRKITLGRKLD